MTLRPYTIDDLARDHNRSRDWASDNWSRLVKEGKLPAPLIEKGGPVWDLAQVYAVRDKALPPAARPVAAAFRAAFDAAHAAPAEAIFDDQVVSDRRRLVRRFAPQ